MKAAAASSSPLTPDRSPRIQPALTSQPSGQTGQNSQTPAIGKQSSLFSQAPNLSRQFSICAARTDALSKFRIETPETLTPHQRKKAIEKDKKKKKKSGEKKKKEEENLYEQFQTISWRKDNQHDAVKTTNVLLGSQKGFLIIWFEISSWVLPGLIGLLIACSGSAIEIGVDHIANWRFGFCAEDWIRTRDTCCSMYKCTEDYRDPSAWRPWASYLWYPDSFFAEYFAFTLASSACILVAASLVRFFAPTARGSGIPEVKTILSGFCMAEVLSSRTLFIKCIGLVFAVGSGLSCGKEGPLVHVACCWGMMCAFMSERYNENEAKRRELLSAAAAAGVSVAFGAPLGGVLFSLEEVSTFFPQKTMWRAFFAAVVAALTLQWLNPTGTGKLTMFEVRYTKPLFSLEYIPFAILGIIGGLVGTAFVALNVRLSAFRMSDAYKQKIPIILEVFIIGLVTSLSSFPSPLMRPMQPQIIHLLFETCEGKDNDNLICEGGENIYSTEVFAIMAIAAIVRFLQTVMTFGTGVPAGLFVPSLFIGACIGRITGSLLCLLDDNYYKWTPDDYRIEPGVYAMVGAAAVLGGVCRVTISLVVIMFELTGALEYIVPFMICVLMSKWVGDYFTDGIYDCHIVLRGYPYLHEPSDMTYSARACDIMEDELEMIDVQRNSIGDLLEKTLEFRYYGFPLVRSTSEIDRILLGYIVREELAEFLNDHLSNAKTGKVSHQTSCIFSVHSPKYILESASKNAVDLSPLVDDTVVRLVPETPVSQVHNVFRQLGLRLIMVVRHGRLQGMITKKNFVHKLHQGLGNVKNDPSTMAFGVEEAEEGRRDTRRLSINDLLPETNLSQPLLSESERANNISLESTDVAAVGFTMPFYNRKRIMTEPKIKQYRNMANP